MFHSVGPTEDFTGLQVTGPKVSVDPTVQKQVRNLVAALAADLPVFFAPDPGVGVAVPGRSG